MERLSQETRVPLCRSGGTCAGFRAKTVAVSGHLPADAGLHGEALRRFIRGWREIGGDRRRIKGV
jgi:hypothetical protein